MSDLAHRDGVFQLPEPRRDPVPIPSRTAVIWDGPDWTEIDPSTGLVIAQGNVDTVHPVEVQ